MGTFWNQLSLVFLTEVFSKGKGNQSNLRVTRNASLIIYFDEKSYFAFSALSETQSTFPEQQLTDG